MSNLETLYATKSNTELRAIVQEDAKRCGQFECWHGLDGYTARLTLGRRRDWGTLDKFD